VKNLFDILSAEARKQMRRRAQPDWCNPMLATLVREEFSNPEWIYEPKLDGIRCLGFRIGRNLKLFSRNHICLNGEFPEVAGPLLGQKISSFIVDGEIMAFDHGVARFSLLQKRKQIHVPVFYYVFDVLFMDGYDRPTWSYDIENNFFSADFHFGIRCVLQNIGKVRVKSIFARRAARAGKGLSRSGRAALICISALWIG
jgi:hypothetical protein